MGKIRKKRKKENEWLKEKETEMKKEKTEKIL